MQLKSILRVSSSALARNKMRTSLTMLGITIGIGAVICTVAIGQGGSEQIQAQLDNLGDNLVWIEAGGRNVNGVRTGNGATKTLLLDDATAIKQSVSTVKGVSGEVDGRAQVVYNSLNWSTSYRGVGPDFFDIRRWPVASGAAFTQKDVDGLANVCILGQTVVDRIFGNQPPLGQTIRVGNLPFIVTGVLSQKGLSTYGQDQDDTLIMPVSTAMHKVKGVSWLDDLYVSVDSTADIPIAQDQIARLLRQRHKIRWNQPDDFNIRSPQDVLNAQAQTSQAFTFMLASIASVSLLVGGIGIMNIMLVSVTERTREIGVRMAVGATERDVQTQFLLEAVMVSLLGGLAGVLSGIVGSELFARGLGWPMSVSVWSVILATLFSAVIGVFFGYYPARKAAALDPIEALRYE
ncbi:MAG TPA: ABC transporter permease [Methylomirabilota bacterium]|nr:ABC transporter permease [Methylomirabilota bacterium]